MDGTYTGSVDRIVDGTTAVVLVEDDGETVDELTLPAEELPTPAREDGGRLSLRFRDGELVSMTFDADATCERRESTRDRLDRLSRRLSDVEGSGAGSDGAGTEDEG